MGEAVRVDDVLLKTPRGADNTTTSSTTTTTLQSDSER